MNEISSQFIENKAYKRKIKHTIRTNCDCIELQKHTDIRRNEIERLFNSMWIYHTQFFSINNVVVLHSEFIRVHALLHESKQFYRFSFGWNKYELKYFWEKFCKFHIGRFKLFLNNISNPQQKTHNKTKKKTKFQLPFFSPTNKSKTKSTLIHWTYIYAVEFSIDTLPQRQCEGLTASRFLYCIQRHTCDFIQEINWIIHILFLAKVENLIEIKKKRKKSTTTISEIVLPLLKLSTNWGRYEP